MKAALHMAEKSKRGVKYMAFVKKIILIFALAVCLSCCGNKGTEVELSGGLTEYSAKNYTIKLPEECEVIASEVSDLSAQYGGCSVAVASMPLEQAVICESKEDFQAQMDALGYNMETENYEKKEINGMEAYYAEYIMEKTKITQITYVVDDIAYTVTYVRPADISGNADKIFIEGMENFSLSGKD